MKDLIIQSNEHNKGNIFSEEAKAALKKIESGSIVIISGIWTSDFEKKPIKLEPLEYTIR